VLEVKPRVWLSTLALCLTIAEGCTRGSLRGKGFDDNEGTWAQKMRPPADEKKFSGVDARAQDIERNLGVR
jgi:hypothetical protein